MLDSETSALIGRIYDSAGDEAESRRLIGDVVGQTASVGAMLTFGDTQSIDTSTLRFYGVMEQHADGLQSYAADRHLQDPTLAFLTANPTARFYDTSLCMTPAQHAANPFIRWSSGEIGFSQWMTRFSVMPEGAIFAMALHANDPHAAEARRHFQLLFGHFDRAQRLGRPMPDMSVVGGCVFLLDALGCVRALSEAGEALVASDSGLKILRGRLVPSDRQAQRRFDMAVVSALSAIELGGVGGAVALPRRLGQRPLMATVDPVPRNAGFAGTRRGAIVRVVDPDVGSPPEASARWRALWQLTPAETRLAAVLVASDCDLRSSAETLGISYATVRTQLTALFGKTGTRSQSGLMRLLARVPD